MMPAKELSNTYIGELYVVDRNYEEQEIRKSSKPYWNCICSCGKHVIKSSNYLNSNTNKYPKSCGHVAEGVKHMTKNGKTNKYEFYDEVGIGYTHDNRIFIFDKEDFEKIKRYCWRIDSNGYVVANSKDGTNKIVWLHRIIMDVTDHNLYVDHKDWNTFYNRKENLRIATKTENNINIHRKKNNTSGYTGVTKNNSGNWLARISKNGIRYNLGTYKSFLEAVEIRHKAELLFHNEWSGEINRQDFKRIFPDAPGIEGQELIQEDS